MFVHFAHKTHNHKMDANPNYRDISPYFNLFFIFFAAKLMINQTSLLTSFSPCKCNKPSRRAQTALCGFVALLYQHHHHNEVPQDYNIPFGKLNMLLQMITSKIYFFSFLQTMSFCHLVTLLSNFLTTKHCCSIAL